MLGLQNLYSKFSNTLSTGLKASSEAGLTPPSPFLGKITNNNLAPLEADTVSFTGRKKTAAKTHDDSSLRSSDAYACLYVADNAAKKMDYHAFSLYRDLLPVSSEVHQEAKKLETIFKIKMCIFDSLLNNDAIKTTKTKPIAKKEVRVKSSQSIAKKMSTVVSELMQKNDGYPVNVSPALVKLKIHDLLGARLILAHGNNGEANAIINRLIESIEAGNGPKIKSIKNYGTHPYLTNKKAEDLADASTKEFGGDYPDVYNKRKTSGYTATHIIIEMANGIDAEIQILGRGVARVKEIEDVCYKGLQGKAISGLPEVSKALKKVGENPELKIAFNKYLTLAYETARTKWDKLSDDDLCKQKFPSINENILPSCLDLNNIEEALVEKAKHKSKKNS